MLKIGGGRVSRKGLLRVFGVFMLAFATGFIAMRQQRPNLPSSAAPTQYTSSISITTSGLDGSNADSSLNFNLETTPEGVIDAKKQTVNVKTNAKNGYKLYISSLTEETALVRDNTAGGNQDKILSSSNPHSSPNTLVNNTWGYAIAKNANTSVNTSNFSDNYNINDIVTGDPIVGMGGTTKWAGLKPKSTPELIAKTATPDNTTGQNLDIYFAVKANSALPAGSYKNTVLYTVLIEQPVTGFNGIENMQDMTPQICETATPEQAGELRDTRDGKTYTVLKAKDGNCWMTQNLALELSPSKTLNPDNTDISNDWTPKHATQSDGNNDSWNESPDTNDYSYNTRNVDYGVLYNWNAAVAGTKTDNFNKNYEATGSICPKGWQLPKDKGIDSYKSLNNVFRQYSAEDYNQLGIKLSGYYRFGEYYDSGLAGHYWSGKIKSSETIYGFSIRKNHHHDSNYDNAYRSYGLAVRCLARDTIKGFTEIATMQDMNPEICASQLTHAEAILRDSRDGKAYSVLKAKDGNCWMTQNLALELSTNKALTQDDTDLPDFEPNWTPENNTQYDDTIKWDGENEYNQARSYMPSINANGNQDGAYGVLYNWYSATGGSVKRSGPFDRYHQETPGSICPKGWKLPIGGSENADKSFAMLYKAYNSKSISGNADGGSVGIYLADTALKFKLSGYFLWHYGYKDFENIGQYWSGVLDGTTSQAYDIYFGENSVVAKRHVSHRISGNAIRCVAR